MEHAPESKTFRQEKKGEKTSLEKLTTVLSRISHEVNEEVRRTYGLEGLVDDSLHIDPHYYSRKRGGIYKKEDIGADKKRVDDLDRVHSNADDVKVQQFYKDTHGVQASVGSEEIVQEIVATFREHKEANKGSQAEMIITALLHKVLKERFFVVRSSVFDDYAHGIDNLILDKETGAVICAFDEVIENEGDRERRSSAKAEKIKKIAMKGGTEAKYGVSLRDKKLEQAHVQNIPVFYLTLESKDLSELANGLFYNNDKGTTEAEAKLFSHLVSFIKEQKMALEKLNLPHVMKEKLEGFESSLTALESFVAKK